MKNDGIETEEKISPGDLYKKLKNEINTIKRNASLVQEQRALQTQNSKTLTEKAENEAPLTNSLSRTLNQESSLLATEHDQAGSATVTPNVNKQHESKFNIPDWFLMQNESKL